MPRVPDEAFADCMADLVKFLERSAQRNTTQQDITPGRSTTFDNVRESATPTSTVVIESHFCTASQPVEATS